MGKNKNNIDNDFCESEIMLKTTEKSNNINEPTLKNIDKMIRRYLQNQQDKDTALDNVETIVTNIVNSFR